jgi:hypothetical protein
MGEAANKLSTAGKRQNLTLLQRQIAEKRALLSDELQELQRRREQAKRSTKLVGTTVLAVLSVASLGNAVVDLFAPEEKEPEAARPIFFITLATLTWKLAKLVGMRYLQRQLRGRM